jgi:ABC-2 type transport system permease protein
MSSAPIADLSYRGYEGTLESPRHRWWVIARMLILLTFKKRSFWVLAFLAGLGFYFTTLVLYIFESMAAGPFGGSAQEFFAQIKWKNNFVTCFGWMQMFLLFITLLAGAGSIANDNRANALLVYLSKPLRKSDYLLGKWAGIAILVGGVTLAQFTLFYLYCLMSYRSYGFLSQDPWLYPKLVLLAAVTGSIYASLMVGISSLFRQGSIAGATFAGLYFITYFFTTVVEGFRAFQTFDRKGSMPMLDTLYYASVDGICYGLGKAILGSDGRPIFQPPNQNLPIVPIPSGFLLGLVALVVCGLFVWMAWTRIRAVEVVA